MVDGAILFMAIVMAGLTIISAFMMVLVMLDGYRKFHLWIGIAHVVIILMLMIYFLSLVT